MRNDTADVARSALVDHPGRPSGSRVPLRTPIVERDTDLRGEHHAETSVQLRAPRSPAGFRTFTASRLASPPNLAEAARSRSPENLVTPVTSPRKNEGPRG